jgi:hypothetical protein
LINSNIAQQPLTDRRKDTQNASFVGAQIKAAALCKGSEAEREWEDRGKLASKKTWIDLHTNQTSIHHTCKGTLENHIMY